MSKNWISTTGLGGQWFSAKLRFELSRRSPGRRELEDRIYLFQSADQDSAERKAAEIGRLKEHEYTTDAGDVHRWRFVGVVKVMMTFLDTPLAEGIEVFSEVPSEPSIAWDQSGVQRKE